MLTERRTRSEIAKHRMGTQSTSARALRQDGIKAIDGPWRQRGNVETIPQFRL